PTQYYAQTLVLSNVYADLSCRNALSEDERSGARSERQPEHAARVGTALRIPEAATLARQAPALHPRRGGGAQRRPARGALDLLRRVPRARRAGGGYQLAGRRAQLV